MPFEKICSALHLGDLTAAPVPLTGGFLHRMYALTTTSGRYAVKILNGEVMARPGVLGNFAAAEAIEARLEQRNLPILPALTIDGRKMHSIGGQSLYVFDYYDGRALSGPEVTPAHSRRIGEVLARIHGIDRRTLPGHPARPAPIDWPALTAALLADSTAHEAGLLMQEALPMLARLTAAADEALARLPRIEAICHNDMDPKNVLWQGDAYRIIDLECLGYADPTQELVDLAISWGGEPLDGACVRAFIAGYISAGGVMPADPAAVYDSRRNNLEWLAYNARRALFADPAERATGLAQVSATLAKLRCDLANRERVLRWLGGM